MTNRRVGAVYVSMHILVQAYSYKQLCVKSGRRATMNSPVCMGGQVQSTDVTPHHSSHSWSHEYNNIAIFRNL